jgi:hypothetical protein
MLSFWEAAVLGHFESVILVARQPIRECLRCFLHVKTQWDWQMMPKLGTGMVMVTGLLLCAQHPLKTPPRPLHDHSSRLSSSAQSSCQIDLDRGSCSSRQVPIPRRSYTCLPAVTDIVPHTPDKDMGFSHHQNDAVGPCSSPIAITTLDPT